MTPFAHQILKQAVNANTKMTDEERRIFEYFSGVQFYEATEIFQSGLVVSVAERIAGSPPADQIAHLPSQKTWVEWQSPGRSNGVLLIEHRDNNTPATATSIRFSRESDGPIAINLHFAILQLGQGKLGVATLNPSAEFIQKLNDDKIEVADWEFSEDIFCLWLHAALFCINSPKVIGRQSHQIHRGLEKKLRREGMNFPADHWTELQLECFKPSNEGVGSETISGKKCLHYVRSFTRVRLGKLEWVTDHWRGDPALGTRHKQYRAVPWEGVQT